MLSGYNTNVRHRGVLFHVQTEDGGRDKPRIVTHLFHGGTAIATDRADYEDALAAPDVDETVRERMQALHKGMLVRLRSGEYDEAIAERIGEGVLAEPTDAGTTLAPAPATDSPQPETRPPVVLRSGQAGEPERPLHELVLDWLVERARADSQLQE